MAKSATDMTSTTEPKVKKTRSPSAPRAVYAVIRILDENGDAVMFPKSLVEVISFEKSAEAVLAKVEGGDFPGALYLRGLVPAGR
jgi:hypothetical protein